MTGVLLRRDQDTDIQKEGPREMPSEMPSEKMAIYMPKREASEGTNPADTFITDF